MALSWATDVRFGRATGRNDHENEAHLSTNDLGGLDHRPGPKSLISMNYLYFYVFSAFRGLLFHSSFWPKCVLRPVFNLCCYLYGCKGRKIISFEVYEKSFFSPNSLASVLSVKPQFSVSYRNQRILEESFLVFRVNQQVRFRIPFPSLHQQSDIGYADMPAEIREKSRILERFLKIGSLSLILTRVTITSVSN
ncbi:hypothetical protein Hanom_Chr04g00381281 [Helianthus anomalus]